MHIAPMKVTLKDVASASGYSISTVSRVLSGSDTISLEVREHVIRCAEKLNYPFRKAKIPLYTNGVRNITLLTDFHQGEFYSSLFAGYVKAADELDVQISLVSVSGKENRLDDVILNDQMHRSEGFILFLPTLEHGAYHDLLSKLKAARRRLPLLSNALIQTPVLPTITFDGYSGGHLAGNHFAERGYKTVGLLKGPAGKAESSFRTNGFKDACESHGLALTWEASGNFEFDSGYTAFDSFQSAKQRPRAVFASNDLMAIGFYEAARGRGLRVPEDVAILGYDDLPMCRQVKPEISSIHTDFLELGRLSLQTLLDVILRKKDPIQALSFVPVTLVKREST